MKAVQRMSMRGAAFSLGVPISPAAKQACIPSFSIPLTRPRSVTRAEAALPLLRVEATAPLDK
jgi:hypothetical protein